MVSAAAAIAIIYLHSTDRPERLLRTEASKPGQVY